MKKWLNEFYEDLRKRFPVVFEYIGKRMAFILAGVLAFLLILAAILLCFSVSSKVGGGKALVENNAVNPHLVTISGYKFLPNVLTIKVGETVTWVNSNTALHDVVFKEFRSGPIQKGKTFKHTFRVAGTYEYVCSYHLLFNKEKHLIIVKK